MSRGCDVCNSRVNLADVADGQLVPEKSTEYGGVSLTVYDDGVFGPHVWVDGMWADGLTSFGFSFPIRYCPVCGRELLG